MEDFYVTLPSNVPNAPFPNTSSRYVTRLPEVLHLKRDQWMVALTDLVYPHSFVNVGKPLHYWIHFKSSRNPIRLTFPSAHYKDVSQIIHTLNQVIRLKRSAADDFIKDFKVKRQVTEDEEEDILSIVEEEEEETTTETPSETPKPIVTTTQTPPVTQSTEEEEETTTETPSETPKPIVTTTQTPPVTQSTEEEEEDLIGLVNEEDDSKEVVQESPGVPKPVASGKEGAARNPMVPQREEIRENQQDGLAGHPDTTKPARKETEGVEGIGGGKEVGGVGGGVSTEQEKPPKKKDKEILKEKESTEGGGVDRTSEPVEGGRSPTEPGVVGGAPKNESKETPMEKKPTEENKTEELGVKPNEEDDEEDDLIDLVNKDEEEKEVKKEEAKKENDQMDEDTIRVVNEDLAQKEAEARAKHMKEERDKLEAEQELIDIINQEQEITEARFTYFNLAQDVLNRPYDPTTYRELLEEFEKLRSLVTIDDPSFNPREYFDFSEENGRIKVNFLHPDIRFLEFDKGCSYFLGFTDTIVRNTHVAPHKVDLFGDVSVIYLYSDVVEPIIVGNKKTNLLSVIPCTGQYGAVVYYTVPNPRYVPLINSTIDSIRIELLTDGGDPIPFSWGTTIAVLHFKKLK